MDIKDIYQTLLRKILPKKRVDLVTSTRNNMEPKVMCLLDRFMLREIFIIETGLDQLKNILKIEYSRYRSSVSSIVTLIVRLIVYTFQPKEPTLKALGLEKIQLYRSKFILGSKLEDETKKRPEGRNLFLLDLVLY
nr:transposase [Candidatus Enterovibrio escacola]